MGLYRIEQGGFACLALLKILQFFIGVIELIVGITAIERGQLPANKEGTAPRTGTLEHSPEQDLSRRNGVDNQTQAYATI